MSHTSAQSAAAWPVKLHHWPLVQPWGCMYAALYAVTGKADLMEHVRDCSRMRWMVRLQEAGLVHETIYMTDQQTPATWWRERFSEWEGEVLMLITCVSRAFHTEEEPLWHQVAALMDFTKGLVSISCSSLPKIWSGTLDAFLASPYATCIEVMAVFPSGLDLYEPEDVFEHGPHLTDFVAAGWQDRPWPGIDIPSPTVTISQPVRGAIRLVRPRDKTHLGLTEKQWEAAAEITDRDVQRMRVIWDAGAPTEARGLIEAGEIDLIEESA